MSNVTCQISISLDGYVAGQNQSTDDPIGEGGMRLHDVLTNHPRESLPMAAAHVRYRVVR